MATPRKHWFRVADSILHEAWTPEQKGILVNLMAYLNGRWARDGLDAAAACRSSLTRGALASITGRVQLEPGRRSLRTLGALVSMTIENQGEVTLISWPKFSDFQGFTPGPGEAQGELVALESPPPHTPPPPHTKRRERPVAAKAAPSPCRVCGFAHGGRGRAFPTKLSESEADALKTWAATKQIPITIVHAAARSIREWYDALPSKRARACWVALIRKAATEEDNKRRGGPGGTGARGAPRPPGPNNPEMPQQAGPREGTDLFQTNNPASGSDFLRSPGRRDLKEGVA